MNGYSLSSSLERVRTYVSLARAYGLRAFLRKAMNAIWVRPIKRLFLKSYSENYEDIIIDDLLGNKRNGFYVDIGANDPLRGNNTMRFYKRGWSGINIEPNKAHCRKFVAKRPRDITLNIGISQKAGKGIFFSFFPDTRSTFSETCAKRLVNRGFKLVSSSEIELRPLADILEEYGNNRTIDFMSVDTEGYDKQVLLRNNWDKFRPLIICVESGDESIGQLLSELGYFKVASTRDNLIYKLGEQDAQSQRYNTQLPVRRKTRRMHRFYT